MFFENRSQQQATMNQGLLDNESVASAPPPGAPQPVVMMPAPG